MVTPFDPAGDLQGSNLLGGGYKMFLVFFVSVIKAVNYLLMEAAAVAVATGGGQRHAGAVLEET